MGKEVLLWVIWKTYKKWCEDTYFDEATRAELRLLKVMTKKFRKDFTKIWNLVLVV